MTFDEVVTNLGGMQAVASLLNVTLQAVCNMKARGYFPSRHWSALVREAALRRKRGVTFESLAAITDTVATPAPKRRSVA